MNNKILISLFSVLFVSITALGVSLYRTNNDLQSAKEELRLAHTNVVQENEKLSVDISSNFTKLTTISEQVSVLDEAISPADKRWAKIKKVRKAVQDVAKNNGYKKIPDINGLTTYSAAVVDFSEQFDVSVPLILAVTTRESAFNTQAVSHAGAQGLMQLMPETAKECANDINKPYFNVFKIKDNVQLGTWYLWKMLNLFNGDVGLAVRSYNAGPTYVKKVLAGEIPNYPRETIDYHEAVLKWKTEYENLGL